MDFRNAPDFAKGERITKPGIYTGVTLEQYHDAKVCDGPSLSTSGLKKIIIDSPEEYWDTSPLNPDREEEEPKAHFTLGRAAHHLLLGEPYFAKLFTVHPLSLDGEAWSGRRNACKAWLAAATKRGLSVLTPKQFADIQGIGRALSKHPAVQHGIFNGKIECSFFWKEPGGIWLKWRPDVMPTDELDFCDLKVMSHVDDDSLERAVDDFGYYLQAAMGRLACRAVLGRELQTLYFFFVKGTRPYSIQWLRCKDDDMRRGEEEIAVGVRVFRHCLETGEWFGPAGTQNDARYLARKPWAVDKATWRLNHLKREIETWTTKPKLTELA